MCVSCVCFGKKRERERCVPRQHPMRNEQHEGKE